MKLYVARTAGQAAIPRLRIAADDPLPETQSLEEYRALIAGQAQEIYDLLTASIAQGVLDHLFALMAASQASVLAVNYSPGRPTREDVKRLGDLIMRVTIESGWCGYGNEGE